MERVIQAAAGVITFVGLAYAISENRRRVRWRSTSVCILVQAILAASILYLPFVRGAFLWISDCVGQLKHATRAGTSFVFGYAGGGDAPFMVVEPKNLFVLGLQALPMVLVVSALTMLFFHWRILPVIVNGFSWALGRMLGIGGALGVCAAAKVFLGQAEAPLLIRPYLQKLTRSELFTLQGVGLEGPLTLQRLLGTIIAPVAFLMGIPWSETFEAGTLLGTKIVLNEVFAFTELSRLPAGTLGPHTTLIMTYVLCGFANFCSIGIQIGALGTMAPERRNEITGLGFRALIAGTISSCMSGAMVGLLNVV